MVSVAMNMGAMWSPRHHGSVAHANPSVYGIEELVYAIRDQPQRDGGEGPASEVPNDGEGFANPTRATRVLAPRGVEHRPAHRDEHDSPRRDPEPTDPDHPASRFSRHLGEIQLLAQLRRRRPIQLIDAIAGDPDRHGDHDPLAPRQLERRACGIAPLFHATPIPSVPAV